MADAFHSTIRTWLLYQWPWAQFGVQSFSTNRPVAVASEDVQDDQRSLVKPELPSPQASR